MSLLSGLIRYGNLLTVAREIISEASKNNLQNISPSGTERAGQEYYTQAQCGRSGGLEKLANQPFGDQV